LKPAKVLEGLPDPLGGQGSDLEVEGATVPSSLVEMFGCAFPFPGLSDERNQSMIILEFRTPELFQQAASHLKQHRIPCVAESSREPWLPNCILLFEDNVCTFSQREALRRAREFEQEDCRVQERSLLPNLAVPS
jgi:hypothetical protein